jgi:5-methylcytosine-specific restriction protein A
MSLRAAIDLVLEEYPIQSQYRFAQNPLADFIRNDLPSTVAQQIDSDGRYLVEGSPGKGQWTKCPWVAIFDRLITESARYGFYVVYLFKQDFEGVYLTLNQGITSIREKYGGDAKHALRVRAEDFRAQLGDDTDGLLHGEIDLSTTYSSSLAAYYEVGSICAALYEFDDMPSEEVLRADLRHFLTLYKNLVEQQIIHAGDGEREPDEEEYHEDLTQLRVHKRVERNRKLSRKAKEANGYICQVCGIDFEMCYGEIGRDFIEAHHLTPLSDVSNQKLKLDPKEDFTVLCSNCHRMIHRSGMVSDIKAFRERHYRC